MIDWRLAFATAALATFAAAAGPAPSAMETQLTHAPRNHDLDNNENFSPDDAWLVFDTRDDDTAIAGNAVIARVRPAGDPDLPPGIGASGSAVSRRS